MSAFAQQPVDAGFTNHRVLAVVPLVGQGTWDDPKRPMFAPVPSARKSNDRSGVIAYQHVVSDDGKFALVEFVFADRSAVAQVVGSNNPQVKAFEPGKQSKSNIESTFKQFKKDFSFDNFHPVKVR
jgi:hypothetical protein